MHLASIDRTLWKWKSCPGRQGFLGCCNTHLIVEDAARDLSAHAALPQKKFYLTKSCNRVEEERGALSGNRFGCWYTRICVCATRPFGRFPSHAMHFDSLQQDKINPHKEPPFAGA